MPSNLRSLSTPATPDPVLQFETVARQRAIFLRLACFPSQLACAEYYRVGLTSVSCYEAGERKIPGWYVTALEQRARELGVAVTVANDDIRKAA